MTKTKLSSSTNQHVHTQVSLRKPLRCGFTILLCSCLFLGASQCRAQETQDAAEAARQERARKDQPQPPKHVYTEDDLGRAKILTPEDEARFAAQRKLPSSPTDPQTQVPLDAFVELPQSRWAILRVDTATPSSRCKRRSRSICRSMNRPSPHR
jgi:hypothetical protein